MSQTKPRSTSKRASRLQPSVTLKLTALAKQMKQEGKPVIGFGAGEPDFDTPDHIKQAAIAAINDGQTKYTAAAGMPELKTSICKWFEQFRGLSYAPEQIVVSCGAKHSIANILLAVLNDGDDVLIPAPYWVSYPEQVRLADGNPVIIETGPETDFKLTPEVLKNAITPATRVLILNSPSNPSGMVYSKAELAALGEVIAQTDSLVISDEIYGQLLYGDEPFTSIASLSETLKNQTIVVDGVAKAYSMTGWRIGYVAAPVEIAKAMSTIQSHTTSNPTTPAQFAAMAALDGAHSVVTEMLTEFKKRRDVMVAKLNAIPGITCATPEGAFYAFPDISGCFGKKSEAGIITDSMSFCDQLLQVAEVSCVPGSAFGTDACMRLSYATSMDAIEQGIERIATFVASLQDA